ncbi:hypothetical protein PAMA_014065 [Pampus argenteus]
MFEKCALFFVASLCVLVESVTDKVSPQQRLSLKWTDDFNIELTWDEKKNCTYDVSVCQPLSCQRKSLEEASYDQYVTMEGGFLSVSVENICNNVKSDRAVLNVTYAELVSHVQCYIHTSDSASCTWQQTHDSSDVHFYYKLVCEGSGPCETVPLRECPSYIYKDQKATGCNLQINTRHSIHMLFNKTFNNTPAKNTFKIVNVKASVPPLDWSVIKAEDKFNISWTPPDILSPHLWEYTINYTECDKQKHKTKIITGYTSTQLNRVPHCQYRMSIKGQYNERGVTPWSDVKHFGMVVVCFLIFLNWKKSTVPTARSHCVKGFEKSSFFFLLPSCGGFKST